MTATEHQTAQALEDLIAACEISAAMGTPVTASLEEAIRKARIVMKRYYQAGAFSVFLSEQEDRSARLSEAHDAIQR